MKLLIIILLFSFNVNAQQYYVVKFSNAETKAQLISKLFYKLSRPVQGTDVTEFLFGYIKHPVNDSIALVMDTAYDLPKGNITLANIDEWIDETLGNVPNNVRNQIRNYINGNLFLRISNLVNRLTFETREDLEARGWFDYNIGQ